ncbi:MAG: Polysaccharide biosynthesis protein, partial [Parcubacteria group bacterium GW2011_GWC2_42_6]
LVVGTFFVSPQIVDLLGGGNYPEAAVILNLLMLAVGVIFFGSLFSFGLIALEGQKKLLRISAWGAIFNLAANFILIPKFSYWAAAATTVLTELLVTILMLAAIKKISQFRPSFSVLNRVLLALLPMAAFLFYFQQSNFVFLISGGGLIYLAALYLTGAISLGEIKELIKK